MEITPEQFKRIEHCLPVQRGNVSLSNLQVVNAMLYVPDGHPKLLHLWPVKLLQAGRSDYDGSGVMAIRAAASFRR